MLYLDEGCPLRLGLDFGAGHGLGVGRPPPLPEVTYPEYEVFQLKAGKREGECH